MYVRRKIRRGSRKGGAWDFILVKSVRTGKKVKQKFVAHLATYALGGKTGELARRVHMYDTLQYRVGEMKLPTKQKATLVRHVERWVSKPSAAECRAFWKAAKVFGVHPRTT